MTTSFLLGLAVCAGCGDEGSGARGQDGGAPEFGDAATPSADLEGPWESLAQRPCPPDSIVTWDNFGASFVLAYCTGCHGRGRSGEGRAMAPAAVTFDDPATIRIFEQRIWARAADDNATMPPVGGPNAEDRELFGQWLACGSP